VDIFEICRREFCCPLCKGSLAVQRVGAAGDGAMTCAGCRNVYLIVDNIPILLAPEYVPAGIKQHFLERHPGCRELCGNLGTGRASEIKSHQMETWDRQYDGAASTPPAHRTLPGTRDIEVHDLFYRNSRRVLDEIVLRRREVEENGVFLDIGCGEGTFTEMGMRNFRLYVGMDISFHAILRCHERFPYKNCVFLVGDAERLPLKAGRADLCAAQWLFEHLEDPCRCSEEMFRVLSDGGHAYVDTNHRDFLLTYRWCQMVFSARRYWRRMREAGHSHDRFFGRGQIETLFGDAGFSGVRTHLCYFLMDMFISLKILAPIRKGLAGLASGGRPQPPGDRVVGGRGLLEFEEKSEFLPRRTRLDTVRRILNAGAVLAHWLLWADRILELAGKGESVILIAEKGRRPA